MNMTPDAQNTAIILLGAAILVDGWALRRDLTRIRFDRQDVREMVRGEVERVVRREQATQMLAPSPTGRTAPLRVVVIPADRHAPVSYRTVDMLGGRTMAEVDGASHSHFTIPGAQRDHA